jgi:AcrR family transcriptional regulator
MARKPARAKADTPAQPPASDRDRIVAAFLALLAEKSFEQIALGEIATRAGVSLGAMRAEFSSTLAIYGAHVKAIDRAVLDGGDGDMAEEPPRERLFDVLMRRIDLLAPHKEAVRSILRSAGRNPGLAFALNGIAVRSQQWMLTAAEISAAGPKGMVRAQGLAVLYASVLHTWLNDEDEGLARTMAALDRALARGQRWSGFLDDLGRFPACACRLGRRRRRDADEGDEGVVAA